MCGLLTNGPGIFLVLLFFFSWVFLFVFFLKDQFIVVLLLFLTENNRREKKYIYCYCLDFGKRGKWKKRNQSINSFLG